MGKSFPEIKMKLSPLLLIPIFLLLFVPNGPGNGGETNSKVTSISVPGKMTPPSPKNIWDDLTPEILGDLGALGFPMEVETSISGSYAEYRTSHLHMGCDFKTYNANGIFAISPFSGYVDAIGQSERAYGTNLILKSSQSNLKAKYAHLLDFRGVYPDLDLLREALALLSGGEFHVKLPSSYFPVPKGKNIARLGESGTGVSHLHFELHLPNGTLNPLPYLPLRGKDRNYPELLLLYLDSDDGTQARIPLEKLSEGKFSLVGSPKFVLSGGVRLRLGAYDLMTSRNNKNNLFLVGLYKDGVSLHERSFRGMSYEEARIPQEIYDSNRSSLFPAVYVYNLFPSKGPSIDLKEIPPGTTVKLELRASDHAGNSSVLPLEIEVGNGSTKKPSPTRTNFQSSDGALQIKTPPKTTYGQGQLTFRTIANLKEELPLPEGLKFKGNSYELESSDLSWVGEAELNWRGVSLGKKDGIYIFDKAANRWSALKQKGQARSLTKLGILAVLTDDAKPEISHPPLVTRHRRVKGAEEEGWEERLYAISDQGSGYAGGAEVLLEGEPYPSEFDSDRKMLILKFPKSFSAWKKKFFLQIRIKDKAGNVSDWFTDLIRFGGA